MISTHILDTTLGVPAAGVPVRLSRYEAQGWQTLASESTQVDGRIAFATGTAAGLYELHFVIQDYYRAQGQKHFFRDARVVFEISDAERKYHVPLIINPYGYSTYRGS